MFHSPKKNDSSCYKCNKRDTNRMVQCDDCDSWCHFKCAQVDETIQRRPWSCEPCSSKKDHDHQSQIRELQAKLAELTSNPAHSATPSQQSIKGRKKAPLERAKSSQKSVSNKSRNSKASRELEIARLDQELKLKLEHLKQVSAIKQEQLESSDEEENSEASEISEEERLSNVEEWLEKGTSEKADAKINTQAKASNRKNWFSGNNAKPTGQAESQNVQSQVTMQHLSMRQIMSSNMRKFAGRTEDWPMFISWFNRSSTECNYSEDENLNRLQQCLHGAALDSVKGYLFYPGTLQQVLNVLRNKYGRPEQILTMLNEQLQSHPHVTQDRIESILDFSVTVQHVVATMKASGLTKYLNNPILVQDLVGKLSGSLKLSWAEYKGEVSSTTEDYYQASFDTANLSTFASWLAQLADKAGSVITAKSIPTRRLEDRKPEKTYQYPQRRNRDVHAAHAVQEDDLGGLPNRRIDDDEQRRSSCLVCDDGSHHVSECKIFADLPIRQRRKILYDYNLCRKCLNEHNSSRCKSRSSCEISGCELKHHSLLHDPAIHTPPSVGTANLVSHHGLVTSKVLYRILPVNLYGPKGEYRTFAFLDEGSTITMIDDEVAEILGLEGPAKPLHLKWTSDITRNESNSRQVSLAISGVLQGNQRFDLNDVRTVESLNLPAQTLKYDKSHSPYPHLKGLPVSEYEDARPRLLIGLNNYKPCLPLKVRKGSEREPVAIKTKLGWTVFGFFQTIDRTSNMERHYFHECECTSDEKLHEQIKEFLSTENFGVKKPSEPLLSKDDQRALEILHTKTNKADDRYETGLLWRYDAIKLPDSFGMAKRRLICLERKMRREPALAANLCQQITEYIDKGYARKLDPEEVARTSPKTWYLPLFAVTNPNKPGKVRMVWDAAATVNGVLLNSVLLKGPDLLCSLPENLFRFRGRKIAISGDIKEMYHQVNVTEEDQQAQRFLWRRDGDPNGEIVVYVMRVMTFGASCSPSTAHYVKNLNVEQLAISCPRATRAVKENHYVDDWLDRFDTEEEAVTRARDVVRIHASAGFEIRNFASNSPEVLRSLGIERVDGSLNLDGNSNREKVLSMWWSTKDDFFFYAMNVDQVPPDILDGRRSPTKREVLRTLMMVFDPSGLVSYFLVYVKILLQEIWRLAVACDQPFTKQQHEKWVIRTRTLPKLREIKIPRCYAPSSYTNLQMHVFVDTSINAFAAVVYFRFDCHFKVTCTLVSAKTKVAPQQPMSIPRLERQTAVLGARLSKSVMMGHSVQPNKKFFWTDSIYVLSWLKSEHWKYRQFVAFRVGEILDLIELNEWRWVPTRYNVANERTKWKEQPKINSKFRWFTGPEVLYLPEVEWPAHRPSNLDAETTEEAVTMAFHSECTTSNLVPKYERLSRWNRFLRSQAWALRWFKKTRRARIGTGKGELVKEETQEAELEIFRQAQAVCYESKILLLKTTNEKPTNQIKLIRFNASRSRRHGVRMKDLPPKQPFRTYWVNRILQKKFSVPKGSMSQKLQPWMVVRFIADTDLVTRRR